MLLGQEIGHARHKRMGLTQALGKKLQSRSLGVNGFGTLAFSGNTRQCPVDKSCAVTGVGKVPSVTAPIHVDARLAPDLKSRVRTLFRAISISIK